MKLRISRFEQKKPYPRAAWARAAWARQNTPHPRAAWARQNTPHPRAAWARAAWAAAAAAVAAVVACIEADVAVDVAIVFFSEKSAGDSSYGHPNIQYTVNYLKADILLDLFSPWRSQAGCQY